MLTIATLLLSGLSSPTRAPVPREAAPDPLGRGYVGIYISTGTTTISQVMPKLPAEKAGLRAGDTILRIGTLEPQNDTQMIDHIKAFRPGAVVEIEIQRGTERKTVKLKLAARPPDADLPQQTLPVPIIDD